MKPTLEPTAEPAMLQAPLPDRPEAGTLALIARIRELSNLYLEQALASRGIVGLLPAHGPVLAFLFHQTGPVPTKALVTATGRVKSTVTGVLNTLEQQGFITRIPSTQDSRVVLVALTESGRALQPAFEAISLALQDSLFGQLSALDRQTLHRLLGSLEANLRQALNPELGGLEPK